MLPPYLGPPPRKHVHANRIPSAMLPIPVTIHQLLICTSLTLCPILLDPQTPLPSVRHEIIHYI